ncbi:MAG: YfhO family protein, partial [Candidatus Rokuibacteriota bacterium]
PPAVRFVEGDPGLYRVFALGRVLHPNTSSYFGLHDIRLVDAVYPARYATYVLEFVNPDFPSFTTILPGAPTRCRANRWFDLLGVKYVFAAGSASPADCGEGSTGSAPGPAPAYSLVWDPPGPDLRVYRNEQAFPRAFLVEAVAPVSDGEAALRRMREATFDPRRVAVVEGLPAAAALAMPPSRARDGIAPVQVLRYEDARVTLRAVTPAPALLVLTDLFYPGWAASVDGAAVPIYAADYAFRGVLVPPGEHVVEFAYRPTSLRVGLGVSLASLVLLALVAGRFARAER